MIAGVDYDTTRLAVCLLEWDDADGDPWFRTLEYRPKKVDAFQATILACARLQDLLKDKAPRRTTMIAQAVDVWWVEHAFGRGPTDFKLGRVQGAIVAALSSQVGNLTVNEVGPSEWKKGVGLPGNAAKPVYQPVLRACVPGDDVVTEHEIDAYGIAKFGRRANLRAVRETS